MLKASSIEHRQGWMTGVIYMVETCKTVKEAHKNKKAKKKKNIENNNKTSKKWKKHATQTTKKKTKPKKNKIYVKKSMVTVSTNDMLGTNFTFHLVLRSTMGIILNGFWLSEK